MQLLPWSIRPQARSNLSPVVLQLIAVADTKFFCFFFQDSALKVTAGQRTMSGPDGYLSGQLSACGHFDWTRKQATRN